MARVLAVSACLLGNRCRYDGRAVASDAIIREVEQWPGPVVPVCPEQLGGLGTPRPAAHLVGGDGEAVLSGRARVCRVGDGADVTVEFVKGAEEALSKLDGVEVAILKARSPSCGSGSTTIDGVVADGDGVFAALLRRAGVRLRTDEA